MPLHSRNEKKFTFNHLNDTLLSIQLSDDGGRREEVILSQLFWVTKHIFFHDYWRRDGMRIPWKIEWDDDW